MTEILAPDFPDWVPPQSLVSADRVLYRSPVGGEALPIVINELDVSLWQSLTIFLEGTTGNTFLPAVLTTAFTVGGDPVWLDFVTLNMNGNETQGDYGMIRTMPVLGPQLLLVTSGSFGTNKGGLIIIGSTRVSTPRIRPVQSLNQSPICLSGVQPFSTTNAVIGYVGPYTNGVQVTGSATSATEIWCEAYANEAGVLTQRLIGGVLANGDPVGTAEVAAPGQVLQVVYNRGQSTIGVQTTYTVTGLV